MAKSPTKSTSKSKKPAKENCVTCNSTTKEVASNKDGGVQCFVCNLWWHPTCAKVEPDLYQNLISMKKTLGRSVWYCASCTSARLVV